MSPDIKLIKVGTSFKEQNVEYIYIGFSKWCKKTYDKEKYDYIYESVELTSKHIKKLISTCNFKDYIFENEM